jgi:hypothetical protein
VRQEIRAGDSQTREELRRDFGIIAESLRGDIRAVAEGFDMVNQKVDREVTRLEKKMDDGFAETQDMIRFGYGNLDRRVTALEKRRG